MKKILLLIIINFIFTLKIIGCSYTPSSFCSTSESFSENSIFYGKIISIDSDGIDFEIIDVLRGTENRTIIRIWDGVDFECNGNWSMAASELGQVNVTLVIVLPKITEKESDWEIIGDYRRPIFFGYTPNLKVENGIISGLITGSYTYPYVEQQTNYENFKNSWETNQNCSSIVLGTENYKSEETFKVLTLSNNKFKILSNTLKKYQVNVFNVFGLKVESEIFINKEIEIDLSNYSSGIYFINLTYENNNLRNLKVIKK